MRGIVTLLVEAGKGLALLPICKKLGARPVFRFANAAFNANAELLAHVPFRDCFGRTAVTAFCEHMRSNATQRLTHGWVVFNLKGNDKVYAAGVAHDAAASFKILERFSFFRGQECVAIHNDDDRVAKFF